MKNIITHNRLDSLCSIGEANGTFTARVYGNEMFFVDETGLASWSYDTTTFSFAAGTLDPKEIQANPAAFLAWGGDVEERRKTAKETVQTLLNAHLSNRHTTHCAAIGADIVIDNQAAINLLALLILGVDSADYIDADDVAHSLTHDELLAVGKTFFLHVLGIYNAAQRARKAIAEATSVAAINSAVVELKKVFGA